MHLVIFWRIYADRIIVCWIIIIINEVLLYRICFATEDVSGICFTDKHDAYVGVEFAGFLI